jgi:hypothetical protein
VIGSARSILNFMPITLRPYFRAMLFPIVLLLLGCVPGLSWFIWSGHGGFGWLLLPLCFPYVLIRLSILVWKAQAAERRNVVKIAVLALLTYVLFAYPTTRFTEWYVNSTIGPFIQTGTMFRLAIFPIGLAFPNHNPKP